MLISLISQQYFQGTHAHAPPHEVIREGPQSGKPEQTPRGGRSPTPSPVLGRHSENMTESCLASSQEADHAAGVQGTNFCSELPD